VDQLKKCYEDTTVANNQWQQTDTSPVSEGEEEEEDNELEVIEIYPQCQVKILPDPKNLQIN